MTDTISSDGSTALATAATGVVNFLANGVVVGTQPVSGGTATFTPTALPGQTNQLTATYSGDLTYASSTSAPVPYAMQPLPSVTMSLPTTVEMSSPTPTPFSVTLTNPGTGADWSNDLYLELDFEGGVNGGMTVNYQDSAGNWCPLISNYTDYLFSGSVTAPCGTEANQFSLAPGQSVTVNFEMSIAYDPTTSVFDVPGFQGLETILWNGSCSASTGPGSCSQSNSPFNNYILPTNSGAPETSGTFTMTYGARTPVTLNLNIPTYAIPQGYDLAPLNNVEGSPVAPSNPVENNGAPNALPTGTETFLVDGVPVGSIPADNGMLLSSSQFPQPTLSPVLTRSRPSTRVTLCTLRPQRAPRSRWGQPALGPNMRAWKMGNTTSPGSSGLWPTFQALRQAALVFR